MEQNSTPTIQVTASGKVVVTNAKDVLLLDGEGNAIATRNRFTLCYCGKTQDGPFCDGSHKQ
jgi:CDGSH-type Zn-finger protein